MKQETTPEHKVITVQIEVPDSIADYFNSTPELCNGIFSAKDQDAARVVGMVTGALTNQIEDKERAKEVSKGLVRIAFQGLQDTLIAMMEAKD